jgi:hypothetical protein
MMTVKELKEALENMPDDMQVIIQKDAEGNGYSPLAGTDSDCIYIADNTWSGEVYDTSWSHYDAGMPKAQWKGILKNPRCLILHPVN